MNMTFFLILLTSSFFVLIVLFGRRFLRIRFVPEEELVFRLNSTRPFWSDFHELLVMPTIDFYQGKIRPAFYKEVEKLARRFRIIFLRAECLLMRFSEYIRGKRIMSSNGHKSHYWEQLNNCKNGVRKENDKKDC